MRIPVPSATVSLLLLLPDVEVLPTAADFAAGRDPELLRAIALLNAGT